VLTVANDANTADTMKDAELARINESAQTSAAETTTTASREVTGTAVTGRATAEGDTRAPAQPQTQRAVTTPPPAETPATTVPQPTATTQRPVESAADTPSMSTDAVRTSRTELPSTASPLPLVALVGFGSLAGAVAFRLRRK
jgi:hypothetical protein